MMKKNGTGNPFRLIMLSTLGMTALLITSCQNMGNYDLPPEFIPEPVGTRHNVAFQMQAAKGEQSKYMIPNSSWYGHTITLSPQGQAQVEWMVTQLVTNPYDVMVETSGHYDLDENRKNALIDYFELQGILDAENFVILSTQPFSNTRPADAEGQ